MRPTKQTVLHSPEERQNGNCFSAVLASLLHLPIESIPYFAGHTEWQRDLNRWLRQFGLAYLEVNACDLKERGIEGLHHEIAGTSPRFDDVLHSTVGMDGAVVFDPHPSDTGLAKIETYGLFLVLEPWKPGVATGPRSPNQRAAWRANTHWLVEKENVDGMPKVRLQSALPI